MDVDEARFGGWRMGLNVDGWTYLVVRDVDRATRRDVGYKVVLDEVVGRDPHPAHLQRRPVMTVERTVLKRFPVLCTDVPECRWGCTEPCGIETCMTVRAAAERRAMRYCEALKAGGAHAERIRRDT